MIFYCVRHGESIYNAEGRIQGQANIRLSDHGRRQSAAAAAAFGKLPIEAIFSSPLDRALETAQAISTVTGIEIRTELRLQEIHAGIFQGLRWSEIESSHPQEARRWLAQEPDFVIPGGESRRALMARGLAALAAIRETGLNHVAVVSHGGLLTAAFKALIGVPADRNPFSLQNASISRLHWDTKIKLMTLNETEHLRVVNGEREGSSGDL